MSVGVLTGRPAEEMPGSTGDQLPELLQLHERVRQAMIGHPGLMAVRLPTRGSWRTCGEASGSTAALPSVEDIGLPSRRQGGLGHDEDVVPEG